MAGDGETVTPSLPEPDVWTGTACADVSGPLRWKRAKTIEARGGDVVQPHQEAGYTSAVVAVDPDQAGRCNRATHEAALLFVPKLGDYTISLPKLDIMAIDQSLGALFGVIFVSAHNVNAGHNMPVRPHDVGAIFLHLLPRKAVSPGSSEPAKRK
jgi:hypothetical protein